MTNNRHLMLANYHYYYHITLMRTIIT